MNGPKNVIPSRGTKAENMLERWFLHASEKVRAELTNDLKKFVDPATPNAEENLKKFVENFADELSTLAKRNTRKYSSDLRFLMRNVIFGSEARERLDEVLDSAASNLATNLIMTHIVQGKYADEVNERCKASVNTFTETFFSRRL